MKVSLIWSVLKNLAPAKIQNLPKSKIQTKVVDLREEEVQLEYLTNEDDGPLETYMSEDL